VGGIGSIIDQFAMALHLSLAVSEQAVPSLPSTEIICDAQKQST
jgi:hypothetical protein